jgi:hypothetical protein
MWKNDILSVNESLLWFKYNYFTLRNKRFGLRAFMSCMRKIFPEDQPIAHATNSLWVTSIISTAHLVKSHLFRTYYRNKVEICCAVSLLFG